MAKDHHVNLQEDQRVENKVNVVNVPPSPLCTRCNSAMDSSGEISQNGKPNETVLDAMPRFAMNRNFSEDDRNHWKTLEEREKEAREESERKRKEELERRRLESLLSEPSTSHSTHLEDMLSHCQNDGPSSSKNNVRPMVDSNTDSTKQILYNRRPLRIDSDTYELESFEKNIMLIFNQYNIDSYTKPREGTHKDVQKLKDTFSKYNFQFIEREDRTRQEIFDILDQFSQNDFSDFGCVSVVVLTHGWDGGVLWAKDVTYNESDLLQKFETHKNPSLVTKPKLFIFQACRGRHPSQSVKVYAPTVRLDGAEEDFFYTLPIESDILILHSTYPGNASHRETEHGSWMIQILCARINELADKSDLLSIITRVQRDVAIDKENTRLNKWTAENRIDKQMPVVTSTFIRKFELVAKPKTAQSVQETETDGMDAGRVRVMNGVDLNYFDYIKNCITTYSEELDNLNDDFAKCLLSLSDTFGNSDQFDDSKMAMANAMCDHLKGKIRNKEAYKYIYLKKC